VRGWKGSDATATGVFDAEPCQVYRWVARFSSSEPLGYRATSSSFVPSLCLDCYPVGKRPQLGNETRKWPGQVARREFNPIKMDWFEETVSSTVVPVRVNGNGNERGLAA
jgi:hypothetical protein